MSYAGSTRSPASCSRWSRRPPSPPPGPFAKSLLDTGWTPGSVVFLRIAGAALLLLVPTVRALAVAGTCCAASGARSSAYGADGRGRCRSWPSSTRSEHLSVGVALLLEYLGLVLVVVWQCLRRAAGSRGRRRWSGWCWRWSGWRSSSTCFGGVRIDGIGVAWGLLAARRSGVVLPDVGQHRTRPRCRRSRWPAAGWSSGALAFAVLGAAGVLPMEFHGAPVELAGFVAAVVGRGARAGRDRRGDAVRHRHHRRPACSAPSWPRSWASPRSCSPCCSPGCCSASCRGRSSCVGGLFILAGVVAVRAEESRPVRIGGRDLVGQRLKRTWRSEYRCSAMAR